VGSNDTIIIIVIMLYSPLLGLGRFFSFLILYTVVRTPWTGDQPDAKPLSSHRTTQTQNKSTQTPMPRVGFEPTIPVFELKKRVHVLERAATVIGSNDTVLIRNVIKIDQTFREFKCGPRRQTHIQAA
jgi:hypothetical protein